MTGAPLVSADGVRVRRGATTIVEDVGLAVPARTVVAVVGPNGSGKSTLVAVLAGDIEPNAGTAELDGRPVRAWTPSERARRRAVLTQDASMAFGFRARDVVAMGRVPWSGRPEAAYDDAVVEEVMAATGITALADRRVSELSGGEQARVVLARTLAQRTPVLLLDEPTASMDLRHAALVLEQARRHAERGGAVVLVVHDLTAAARWADQVVLLDGGRVAAKGTPREVLQADLLSRVYGIAVDVADDARGELTVSPVVTR